nr:hypothetical protein [Tanacetum cinerariifolium]
MLNIAIKKDSLWDKIKSFVVYKIGDGRTISTWHDNWSSVHPVNNYVTHRNLYDARLADNMRVCDMVRDGKWDWPSEWYYLFHEITGIDDPVLLPNINDKVVWKSTSGKEVDFSMKNISDDLCINVHWWKLFWFSRCIPNSLLFCGWLIKRDWDKLSQWGIYAPNMCMLGQNDIKSHDRLFLGCSCSVKKGNLEMVGSYRGGWVSYAWSDACSWMPVYPFCEVGVAKRV